MQEYEKQIHLAGRKSLSQLIESSDFNTSINDFLSILGFAMSVDRARLIRFRIDGRAFITHEWVRNSVDASQEVPEAVQAEAVHWSKKELELNGKIVIQSCDDPSLPKIVQEALQGNGVAAILAVPAIINGSIEAMACFDVSKKREWLPVEIEESLVVLNGYARSVERRIEDRKNAAEELQLRKSEEQYRLITSHSPVVLFGIDSKGIFTLSEGLGLGRMGADAGSVVGHSVYHIYKNHPDVIRHFDEALAGNESHARIAIGDKVFEGWFTPVLDEGKMVIGVSGVAVDITRRHELEKQQTIMMSELDHRVKNNISSVLSLVDLSKQNATSIEEFASSLDGRLHALAIAHSSLSKTHWRGAELGEILRLTLEPYMAKSKSRIEIDTIEIKLPGVLARPMCMVIHELATNAMKHGALSNDEGVVLVSCRVNETKNICCISWEEKKGPEPEKEINSGTGTTLLEGLISHEMNGKINSSYDTSGFHCEIEIPI